MFDGVLFIDLAGHQHKARIWGICRQRECLDPRQPRLDDAKRTAAKIKS